MKRILVCGVTGFIGRNMAEFFAKQEGYEVYGVYHKRPPFMNNHVKFLYADLRNAHEVNEALDGMDIVIQAAATTSGSKDIVEKPYIHVTDNAVMNSLIFRTAFEKKIKHVVFFSCGVMYQPLEIPRKESDLDLNADLVPQYFGIGWTKVYIEKMCQFYSQISETKYTVLRQSNIYGPYDKYDYEHSHMFGANLRKVMDAKEGEEIIVWGNGKECRDLLYVADVVEFVKKAIENQEDGFQLCNVSSGQAFSVREIVESLIRESGKNLEMGFDLTKPSIPTKLSLDPQKANELFGWKPRTSLADGIKKTMEWYRKEGL